MSRRSKRYARAFTLVEVLAAMLLISIVVPVAMHASSAALMSAQSAKRTAEASTLAETKLNELVATGEWTSAAGAGDFTPDHPEYRWSLQTDGRDFGVTELALTVTWQHRGSEKSLTVSTLVSDVNLSSTGVMP